MRPDEIVVGGVYRGKKGMARRIVAIEASVLGAIVVYRGVRANGTEGNRTKVWLHAFASWATERVDTP
jgi:hypothetical protein